MAWFASKFFFNVSKVCPRYWVEKALHKKKASIQKRKSHSATPHVSHVAPSHRHCYLVRSTMVAFRKTYFFCLALSLFFSAATSLATSAGGANSSILPSSNGEMPTASTPCCGTYPFCSCPKLAPSATGRGMNGRPIPSEQAMRESIVPLPFVGPRRFRSVASDF